MIDTEKLKIEQIFDNTPLGRLFYYLNLKIKQQEKTCPQQNSMLQWQSEHTIAITNVSLFTKKIYQVPYQSFKFSYFTQFKFKLLANYCIYHPNLSPTSSKEKWMKLWFEVQTNEFFDDDSQLLNLFLLLQLSKVQEKMQTPEPPSPVCWLPCGRQIQFRDAKKFLAFAGKRDYRFRRKKYGFQTMSKLTMTHQFIKRDSPVEAWVAAKVYSKTFSIRNWYVRSTYQSEMNNLKKRLKQLKQNQIQSEEVDQLQREIQEKQQEIKWKYIYQRKGIFDDISQSEVKDNKMQYQNQQSGNKQKENKRQRLLPRQGKSTQRQRMEQHCFLKHKKKKKSHEKLLNKLSSFQFSGKINRQLSYKQVKAAIKESIQQLQDTIVKLGSRNIVLYKSLLQTFGCCSNFLTQIEKFQFNFRRIKNN